MSTYFLVWLFLKRKLCFVLFAVCLTLLLQTNRKWGVDQGCLCEFLKLVSLLLMVMQDCYSQSESLFHVATLREGINGIKGT